MSSPDSIVRIDAVPGEVALELSPWAWKLLCASPLVDPDCKQALRGFRERDGNRLVHLQIELAELLFEEICLWLRLRPLPGGRTGTVLADVGSRLRRLLPGAH